MNPYDTHEVSNQVAPFADINLFDCDPALREALLREGGAAEVDALHALGRQLGRAETLELARLANRNGPLLVNFDGNGRRIDEVEFHPAWHSLMALLIGHGAHASPWDSGAPGAQVARAARYILFGQVENGSQCPVTMTYASVAALRLSPRLAARWLPKILSRVYDPRSLPIEQKHGALLGMGMTEKQGGSDVRSNTTMATALAPAEAARLFGDDGEDVHRIVGHKWFFSAPQSDAHLILAQTAEGGSAGPSCFLLPRYLPDGSRNQIRVQRLKDKLGNRSNASSEVEFTGAYGWLLGQLGRGIPTILEMGSHTRLDCVLGSAGTMRAALTHALHHARHRAAFGRPLAQQPLMQNVLADLALESEAASAFALLRRARRSGPGAAGAHPDAGRQVLDLQARPGFRRRGDGGARRQRLCRGRSAGAAVPRIPGQLDLGGLGQRHVPRPVARPRQDAGRARGAGGRAGAGGRGQRLLCLLHASLAAGPGLSADRPARGRIRRAPAGRAHRAGGAGRPVAAARAGIRQHGVRRLAADARRRRRFRPPARWRRLRGHPGAGAGRADLSGWLAFFAAGGFISQNRSLARRWLG